jgi:hypothetical protein
VHVAARTLLGAAAASAGFISPQMPTRKQRGSSAASAAAALPVFGARVCCGAAGVVEAVTLDIVVQLKSML